MAPPKGNRFWEVRSTHGRNPIFATPEDLWEASCEYFQWVEENPLTEYKVAQYQGVPVPMEVPKMRAMTIQGLCLFLDINRDTFYAYKAKDDFSDIVDCIDRTIYQQKLTGAAADLLNSNIIARELGLTDKQEIKSKSVTVDITKEMNPQDAARAYQDMMED